MVISFAAGLPTSSSEIIVGASSGPLPRALVANRVLNSASKDRKVSEKDIFYVHGLFLVIDCDAIGAMNNCILISIDQIHNIRR